MSTHPLHRLFHPRTIAVVGAELELNPVIVHADGSGLTVADGLGRLARAAGG